MIKLPPMVVPTGTRGKIIADLNTTYKQVSRALSGSCSTPLHFEIRKLAEYYGGKVVTSAPINSLN